MLFRSTRHTQAYIHVIEIDTEKYSWIDREGKHLLTEERETEDRKEERMGKWLLQAVGR